MFVDEQGLRQKYILRKITRLYNNRCPHIHYFVLPIKKEPLRVARWKSRVTPWNMAQSLSVYLSVGPYGVLPSS